MSEPTKPAQRATSNRSTTPVSDRFAHYISSQWQERADPVPAPREHARYAAARRNRLSAQYLGKRLIAPAGSAKQRANDTDYPFRAHSDFAYLTGWGSDSVAGAVLVLEPHGNGHDAILYFREGAGRATDEFYANTEIGEFWTGPRPSTAHVASDLGLATKDIAEFAAVLASVDAATLVLREADRDITDRVDRGRDLLARAAEANSSDSEANADTDGKNDGKSDTENDNDNIAENENDARALAERDAALARDLSEMRLVKDAFEITELRAAITATKHGFDDVIDDLGQIIAHRRGERLVEGTFNRRARAEGNTVGYDVIAASGPHACILHWTSNNGQVKPGELILIDAGVERESYYTADITRTLPVNGHFNEIQRRVYEAVLEAADAALAVVRPGILFREIHAAAMTVIAHKTAEWGLIPVTAEESLQPENQHHRRYMVHGTSHHLGLDVHDCAAARRELYLDGVLEAGMVFTIEPGLYFQPDDLSVPEEYRGIGVRIEDNILVTEAGGENLSAEIPRTTAAVEAWLSR